MSCQSLPYEMEQLRDEALRSGQDEFSPSWGEWLEGLSRSIGFLYSAASLYARFCAASSCVCRKLEERDVSEINRHYAAEALELTLDMKGYYIKAAQTMCGAGVFPVEFDDVFAMLLDQCPSQPFEVAKKIVEDELGQPLDHVFADFDQQAVAAASIGQVHLAKLRDGTEVAVKVQYPDVERYFRMDMQTILMAMRMRGMGAQAEDLCKRVAQQFEAEFDYRKEAGFMREIKKNVEPRYRRRIAIPEPVDAQHRFCSSSSSSSSAPRRKQVPKVAVPTLCTRKVLTMERLHGTPVRKYSLRLMAQFAESKGMTLHQVRSLSRKRPEDLTDAQRKLMQEVLAMGPVSECAHALARTGVKVHNTVGCLAHFSKSCCFPSTPYKRTPVPLNGARIAKLLFDVHGHELFHDGLFNSDPHAGNVLVLDDGRLGLLDYGAVLRLSGEEQAKIARLIIAVADQNDAAVPSAMFACGFKSERMDPKLALLMAYVCFHRGPHPDDLRRLAPLVGLPEDADIATVEDYIQGGKIDKLICIPSQLLMLQRCAMILSGVGLELGAGRLSSAQMFRPQAVRCLKRLGQRL